MEALDQPYSEFAQAGAPQGFEHVPDFVVRELQNCISGRESGHE